MMMPDYKVVVNILETGRYPYCAMDVSEEEISFLIPEDAESMVRDAMKGMKGWKKYKDRDTYLYSLKPMLHYGKGNCEVYYHFKLSCRSALNGAWVPLDRYINGSALKNAVMDVNMGFRVLSAEDAACYLLADCIYTKKSFPPAKRDVILRKIGKADRDMLKEKLSRVFFKFSGRLLDMAEKGEFDRIITAFFAFAEY